MLFFCFNPIPPQKHLKPRLTWIRQHFGSKKMIFKDLKHRMYSNSDGFFFLVLPFQVCERIVKEMFSPSLNMTWQFFKTEVMSLVWIVIDIPLVHPSIHNPQLKSMITRDLTLANAYFNNLKTKYIFLCINTHIGNCRGVQTISVKENKQCSWIGCFANGNQ